eukprot:TRINITY_DN398_c0_g2_i3.p1 TRINITY_DN398_c0_g2~~TRINITY_DN398_c0_g2_i3.p1  ORF type:complete len:512 (+),score=36.28 TRINITY_DN398_c0_g2_i3:290-1825(+)
MMNAADSDRPTKKTTMLWRFQGSLRGISSLLVFLSTLGLMGQASAQFTRGGWLEKLKPPDWSITHNFMGVPSASLYSHERYPACFLVMWKVCHVNYAPHYDAYLSGAWYSMVGHNLSKLAADISICRLTDKIKGRPSLYWASGRAGRFLSKEELDPYLAEEDLKYFAGNRKREFWDGSSVLTPRAIIAPHDTFPGHVVRDWGMLADLQHSIWESLGRPTGTDVLYGDELTYYWPGLLATRVKHLPVRVLKTIFGPGLQLMVGKRRVNHSHACFEETILPFLNSNFLEPSEAMFNFKQRIYQQLVKPPQVLPRPTYQVTWLWRTTRRYLLNSGEMLHFLTDTFQDFPVKGMRLPIKVVEFDDKMPYEEVIRMMRATAFAIGMHGAAMFQETFMPVGSHMLELLPYKSSQTHFQDIGLQLGVKHEVWLNTHKDSTVYDNNCFTNSSWHDLIDFDCVRIKACFSCTKDHANTRVNIPEIQGMVEAMKPALRTWLLEQHPELESMGSVQVMDDSR